MLNDLARPVQFIFAGKSHPRDEGGKALIQEVYKLTARRDSITVSSLSRITTLTSRAVWSREWISG